MVMSMTDDATRERINDLWDAWRHALKQYRDGMAQYGLQVSAGELPRGGDQPTDRTTTQRIDELHAAVKVAQDAYFGAVRGER
jgi:muramoyltetrapeptide carboxypeptidase LdcA involved in peptidoglycan recycling